VLQKLRSVWEQRPEIDIPKTRSEKVWDVIGYASYMISIILLMVTWMDLPDRVPAHFNASGEVDRWGSKYELFILPGIGFFSLVLMQLLEKHPEWHNYPKRLNEENVEQFYLLSRKILNQTKNLCLILFSVIIAGSISIAMGKADRLSMWFFLFIVIISLLPVVVGLIKQRKIK